IIWELARPLGPETTMHADCALFVNRLGEDERPDLMYHTYQIPFTFNTERLGYRVPDHAICMTPNIPLPRSKGWMWLLSGNPDITRAPASGYFPDGGGYDATPIGDGLKRARGVAAREPFASKPQLAGLLDRAHAAGIRAAFVAGDEVYGGRQLRRGI